MTTKTMFSMTRRHVLATATVAALAAMTGVTPAHAADTIKVGLIASLSGPSAKSGEAITRGLTVAIDEINAAGGLLGKQVELLRRDDENNPGKGLVAARELVQREKVAVLFGGLQTPVSLAIVPFMNQSKAVFMGPWAAGTPITQNGAKENYIFRVSAFDSMVGVALVDRAVSVHGAKKPGMMLINNPWGESNEKSLLVALKAKGMENAGIEKIEQSDIDVVPQLTRLKSNGADATFTFSGNPSPKAAEMMAKLKKHFPEIKGEADVTPAVGIANAYDGMHLAALAIKNAGSTDGPAVRKGFYNIKSYDGLIKTYEMPFSPEKHDALGPDDLVFTQFIDGKIIPVK